MFMKKLLITFGIILAIFLIAGAAVKILYFTGPDSGEKILKTAFWLDKSFKTNLVKISADPFYEEQKITVTSKIEVWIWNRLIYAKTIKRVSKCEFVSFCPSCQGIEIAPIHNSPEAEIGFKPEWGKGSAGQPFLLLNKSIDLDDDIVLCQWQVMNTSHCFDDSCYNECFKTCDDINLSNLSPGKYRAVLSVTDSTGCSTSQIRDFIIE